MALRVKRKRVQDYRLRLRRGWQLSFLFLSISLHLLGVRRIYGGTVHLQPDLLRVVNSSNHVTPVTKISTAAFLLSGILNLGLPQLLISPALRWQRKTCRNLVRGRPPIRVSAFVLLLFLYRVFLWLRACRLVFYVFRVQSKL